YGVPRGGDIQLVLPSDLDPQAPTVYPARVIRSAPATSADGKYMTYLVLEFRLSRELQAQLEYVVATQARNPRLSKLAEPVKSELTLEQEDRRTAGRHAYPEDVAALTYVGAQAPTLVRGHEISLRGMRVEATRDLAVGQRLMLGLYRGASRSPLMLHAQV